MTSTEGKARGRLGKGAVKGDGDVGTIREQRGNGQRRNQEGNPEAWELGFIP